ncbi:hypothetical protein CEXT_740281 [Caerostris extrusa]|uniref:Uncharacterized protein n=1 Tax=Caerostris extrusa TaxID=172846 RepID=A0AAV4SL48_CAEEX|nr:hypothetical protein CEXT_740281 [Caerostris extrusa]
MTIFASVANLMQMGVTDGCYSPKGVLSLELKRMCRQMCQRKFPQRIRVGSVGYNLVKGCNASKEEEEE